MLDELLDDLCGQSLGEARQDCGAGTAAVDSPGTCRRPGQFERNPNGYFGGLFYTDETTPGTTNGMRDVAAFQSYLETYSASPFQDDQTLGVSEAPSGLVSAAFRGIQVEVGPALTGAFRTADHVCVPLDGEGCGVSAPDAVPVRDYLLTEDAEIGQSSGSCPAVRAGARNRFPAPAITPVSPGADLGCCPGYEPIPCSTSEDCVDLFFRSASAGFPFARCVDGVCERCVEGGCPYGTASDTIPVCRSTACTPQPFYCDDTLPNPPAVSGFTDPDGAPTGLLGAVTETMATVRDTACAPGSRCEPAEVHGVPATLLRQVLGHYAVRALPQVSSGLASTTSALQSVVSSLAFDVPDGQSVRLSEQLGDAHVGWAEHHDGNLELQGYLQMTLTLRDSDIEIDIDDVFLGFDADVGISPSVFRFRLQPYFYASPPPRAACDSCGRRRPDLTMRWAVESATLLSEGSEAPPRITGCDVGCLEVSNCYLSTCDSQELNGREVTHLTEVADVFDEALFRALSRRALGQLDELLWSLTSDPVVGGMVFGRLEAVESVTDAPACLPATTMGGPALPAVSNPECTTTGPSPESASIADTIEQLRVRAGRAEVRSRDNGPFLP